MTDNQELPSDERTRSKFSISEKGKQGIDSSTKAYYVGKQLTKEGISQVKDGMNALSRKSYDYLSYNNEERTEYDKIKEDCKKRYSKLKEAHNERIKKEAHNERIKKEAHNERIKKEAFDRRWGDTPLDLASMAKSYAQQKLDEEQLEVRKRTDNLEKMRRDFESRYAA